MDYQFELHRHLATHLVPDGFQAMPPLNQYRRVTDSGFHNVLVSVGGGQPVVADLQVGIRLDLVERLVYQFTGGLSDYGPHSTTLLVSLGQLRNEPYQRYLVAHPNDVSQVVQAMQEAIKSDGYAFFHRYDSARALDELYNATDARWLPHFVNRSLRGITLAKLAHRDDWTTLVTNYRAKLQQRGTPEVMMNKFDQLATYLKHFSVN